LQSIINHLIIKLKEKHMKIQPYHVKFLK